MVPNHVVGHLSSGPGTGGRRLGARRACVPYQSELPDQSSLPAGGEPSTGAGGPGRVPGMLAGHDGGHDVAIEHADGLHDRVCRPAAATPSGGAGSVPGCVWRRLDGVRALCFLGDTRIHWLVDHWFWLYMHSWVIGATTFA